MERKSIAATAEPAPGGWCDLELAPEAVGVDAHVLLAALHRQMSDIPLEINGTQIGHVEPDSAILSAGDIVMAARIDRRTEAFQKAWQAAKSGKLTLEVGFFAEGHKHLHLADAEAKVTTTAATPTIATFEC